MFCFTVNFSRSWCHKYEPALSTNFDGDLVEGKATPCDVRKGLKKHLIYKTFPSYKILPLFRNVSQPRLSSREPVPLELRSSCSGWSWRVQNTCGNGLLAVVWPLKSHGPHMLAPRQILRKFQVTSRDSQHLHAAFLRAT